MLYGKLGTPGAIGKDNIVGRTGATETMHMMVKRRENDRLRPRCAIVAIGALRQRPTARQILFSLSERTAVGQ